MELVLTRDENARMMSEVLGLILRLNKELDTELVAEVLKAMGITRMWETFSIVIPE